MRGNLSTLYTVTVPYFAFKRARVNSKPSTAQGPTDVQTTLESSPKIPSSD